ncbi:MAG: hypothetical protein E6I76_12050 [Chloroflexi bacterium]|nr:MAG: hypothetical protein E6I76_12050 [Chloroflexota bacterium]
MATTGVGVGVAVGVGAGVGDAVAVGVAFGRATRTPSSWARPAITIEVAPVAATAATAGETHQPSPTPLHRATPQTTTACADAAIGFLSAPLQARPAGRSRRGGHRSVTPARQGCCVDLGDGDGVGEGDGDGDASGVGEGC